MWKTKYFYGNEAYEDMMRWIARNRHRVAYDIIFIENGYAVQYKELVVIG